MKKIKSGSVFFISFTFLTALTLSHRSYAEPSPRSAQSGSLYEVPLSFKNDQDQNFSLKNLQGKKSVMVMVYTSCQSACPLIMKKMKKVEAALKKSKTEAEFVVISFDTVADSPKKLAHFRKHMEVPSEHWTLAVGTEKNTRMLSNLLNVKYSRNPENGEIMHDNKIILLNEKGEIVKTLEGLSAQFDSLF